MAHGASSKLIAVDRPSAASREDPSIPTSQFFSEGSQGRKQNLCQFFGGFLWIPFWCVSVCWYWPRGNPFLRKQGAELRTSSSQASDSSDEPCFGPGMAGNPGSPFMATLRAMPS